MPYEEQTCGDCHEAVAVCVMFATRPRDIQKLIYRCAKCAARAHEREQNNPQDAKQIAALRKKIERYEKTC